MLIGNLISQKAFATNDDNPFLMVGLRLTLTLWSELSPMAKF